MALAEQEASGATELLAASIERPFFTLEEKRGPVQEWFGVLTHHFPLLAFRADAYLRLGNRDLPSTDPLARILKSVLADEGWKGLDLGWDKTTKAQWDLELNLAARRRELAQERGASFWSCLAVPENGGWRVQRAYDLRSLPEAEPIVEWDDDGPAGVTSVYEEIGRELVGRIEHRDAQKVGTKEAEEAQAEIDAYLKQISARRGRGRPPRAATDEALSALHEEAAALLQVVGGALEARPSDEARSLLAAFGVTKRRDQDSWSARLAAPVLSARELIVVCRNLAANRWATARRLSILVLARRLKLDAPHLARRLVGADEEEEFKEHARDFEL